MTGAPVPVVVAVNGPAIGAGTQLAVACDLRGAEPHAVFAVPTARLRPAVDPWTVRRLAYSKLALDRTDLAEDDPMLLAAFGACWRSADLVEGRRARAERRPAVFVGG